VSFFGVPPSNAGVQAHLQIFDLVQRELDVSKAEKVVVQVVQACEAPKMASRRCADAVDSLQSP
jgi:hypothetical protein